MTAARPRPLTVLDDATSHRVKLLRFPLILLVLYIHCYLAPVRLGSSTVAVVPAEWLITLQAAWSNGFARTAVPLFFLISGYLYFVGFGGSFAAYRTKTVRRIGTLLVPLLFWNLLIIALFALGQSIPAIAGYFNADNGRMLALTPFGFVDLLIGITHFPLAYQFWFIRDLMVIALFALPLHWLLQRTGPTVPILLLVWWLFDPLQMPFLKVPSLEATTYFTIGAWLAMTARPMFPPVGWLRWLAPLYLTLLASDVAIRTITGRSLLFCITILVGIVFVLALTGLVRAGSRVSRTLATLSLASFFVFAAHEPLMTLCRKLIYRALQASQATIFTAYALLPLVLAGALTLVYFGLRQIVKRLTAIISGGR
ncbi:acyltransferase family protein [Sphingomonas psychrolutea]|uniref:Acyltransferase 3 domain-containing protein n=1 Tax=Sphingomonas psychrolutea TaxID=1259676 RepID=A0ABQ1G0C6_9SPHN|nr:acyltransferase [Sphingomonas psychrolutea]GGA34179.1 hypothetical protein GCM10011395_00590 [Sphingomonas psychrolutea]